MGTTEYPFELGKDRELRLPASLTVVATSELIAQLVSADNFDLLKDANLLSLPLDAEIPEQVVASAGVLVTQVDPQHSLSMRRIAQIRAARPDLPQIVALSGASVKVVRALLREGVADVVSLPLEPEEILQTALDAIANEREPTAIEALPAPLIAIVRATGGSGATTIATHLAQKLGQKSERGRGTCIIDLDIQNGSVSDVLGVSARRTLSDLLAASDRLDGSFLRSVAVARGQGLSVIAAPKEIMPLESIDAEQLHHVVEVARADFDYVVLDLPSGWTNWNLSTLLVADSILLVVELSLASLHQAKRRLELFATVGVRPNAISIVPNKVEKRLFRAIGLSDVTEALGHKVIAGIHVGGSVVTTAQEQGLFVDQVQRKSRFENDISDLSELLVDRLRRNDRK